MKLITTINPQNVLKEEYDRYGRREASRAIVIDENNNVALLHVTKEKYYKLPGGGIDKGESKIDALQRECLEEIGCNIEVIETVGSILEHRKIFRLNQISYCYVARVTGEKGQPQFTKEEIEDGFEQVWLPFNEALSLVSNNEALTIESKSYIVPRDSEFLKEAELILNNLS